MIRSDKLSLESYGYQLRTTGTNKQGVAMTEKMRKIFEQETLPYLDDLWQIALWLTDDEHNAENLVEDSFIEASRLWDETTCRENCRVWMFKVLVKIFLRENKLVFLFPSPKAATDDYEPFSTERISLVKGLSGEFMTGVLRSLPVGNRLVIVLSIFEKLSYRQIADIAGISAANVGQKIYQAYSAIHKKLNDYFADKIDMQVANCN
jgi:RNA polymerase sigma-70 factor (ECF subfamily)